jgi:uncharacterized protein YcbK (DUF882 family)
MSEQLSKNFNRVEFACRCGCGSDHVKPELIAVLQRLRDKVKRPVVILSGVRCLKHNKRVGGASRSRHLVGDAADVRIKDMTPRQVAKIADSLMPGTGGVKAYSTFTHIDTRPGLWRA